MVRIGPNTVLDETTWNSPNYTPQSSVPAVFGMARNITGITIHHWGAEGQRFEDVANYLSRPNGNTSAHFVVEGGRAACLITPANAAWHSGSAVGNATTIGIECRPEMTEADFTSLVELIVYLEGIYGDMKIFGHKDWFNTACPGKYYHKLANLIDRVNEAKANPHKATAVNSSPAAGVTMGYPLEGKITQAFNGGRNLSTNLGGGHTGVDYGVPVGTSVKATADGTVLWADWASKLPRTSWESRWYVVGGGYGGLSTDAGILVVIDHGDFLTLSCHLNETKLNTGDKVKLGQEIGKSGATGFVYGAHLHFEVLPKPFKWTNGWYGRVDPIAFIEARKAKPQAPAPATPAKAPEAAQGYVYTVARGDTISGIARRMYGSAAVANMNRITSANGISNPSTIKVGQKLTIPGIATHVVARGDTLSAIARKFYKEATPARVKAIVDFNKLQSANHIKVGQRLGIPTA